MAARGQPEVGADRPGTSEAARFVDSGTEGQGIDRPDPRHSHETTALIIVPGQDHQLVGETDDLTAYSLAHGKEG